MLGSWVPYGAGARESLHRTARVLPLTRTDLRYESRALC